MPPGPLRQFKLLSIHNQQSPSGLETGLNATSKEYLATCWPSLLSDSKIGSRGCHLLALEMGEFEIADALLQDLAQLVSSRDGGPSNPLDGV